MPIITLPDGSQKSFDHAVSIHEIAKSIGSGLAKAALAGKVSGEIVDTSYLVETDAEISIITSKDADGVDVLRHSCAHLMAQAVQQLFPSAQVTIGPVIEDGFFYDFAYERAFTPEDLQKIEKRMKEISKQNLQVSRSVMSRNDAVAHFKEIGEDYKVK
ncbi:MAG: TGS domain-containing protein, partial [Gammaproteobacteria bacterium]|nr:TGS domain-containing protein [Gammaproteobacteria bacterium]